MENKENNIQNQGKCDFGADGQSHLKAAYENHSLTALFNPDAEPFRPRQRSNFITVGPTNIPVNANIWSAISSNQDHTHRLNPALPVSIVFNHSSNARVSSSLNCMDITQLLPLPSAFEIDSSRQFVFRRDFGPVATPEGVELRLRFGVRIYVTTDGSILIENGEIRVSVNPKADSCALEHPNGRIYKNPDRVDLVTFDGMKRNRHIRFGKMWKDCISFTSVGCALTYLVDPAGMRTTSDHVNRDWNRDYCRLAFLDGIQMPDEATRNLAATDYHYKVEKDDTEVFIICGIRISQAKDGMLKVYFNPRSINSEAIGVRCSVENKSVTLKLNNFHCTASLGSTPHLFIRNNERRVHFDGSSFVVRNLGHSASFDKDNYLRIH